MLNANLDDFLTDHQSVNKKDSLLDLLFYKAPDPVLLLESKNCSIIESNEKALELFEVDEKSVWIGSAVFELFHNEPTEFSKKLFEMNIKKEGELHQELSFKTLKQHVFWGRLTKNVFRTGGKEYILLRIKKLIDQNKSEEILTTILRGTARVTGKQFFKELTKLICSTFNVNIAFIAKISDHPKRLDIIEITNECNKELTDQYELNGILFDNIIKGNTTCYPRGVSDLFPDDGFVKSTNIESFMGVPIFNNTGDVTGLIGLMDDEPIQELPNSQYILSIFASRTAAEIQRIRSKEILSDQTRNLSTANEIKDRLLSILSHDLVNPLHTIMGFSELLRNKIENYEKEKIIERVEIIDNSIRNIYFMLDNLTSWSNFYRNNVKISRDFISVREIMEENLSLFKYIIDIKNLSVTIPDNPALTIYTDKKMVNSMVRNILSNAVKFTPKGGTIVLGIEEKKADIIISIEDSGIGISPEELELINNSDKEHPDLVYAGKKSTGLGLLLTRLHAEWLGGSFSISSKQNKGTSVIISIPRG